MPDPWPYEPDEYGDDRIWQDSNGGHPDSSIWGWSDDDDSDKPPF
jgi:hypothetical protein